MKTFVGVLVVAILGGIGLWYWSLHDDGAGNASPAAGNAALDRRVPVRLAVVEPLRFETVLESLGTAQANESVTLTATVTANVAAIGFRDGDEVEAGQVLVRLASAEELAEQREAQVTLTEQRRELNRIRGLAADGIVPRQQVDQQRSRVEEAEARLAAVEARLSDRVIRAPFSGVLGLRRVSTGSLVTPGTAVAELDDISLIKVDFTIPERFLGVVRRGMPIEARSVAFRDRVFEGVVTAISTRVDVATRTFTVRAEIDNPDRELRPGMLLTTRLALDPADRLAIPEGAVLATADQHFVFVLAEDGTVQRRQIRIGRRQPGWVEVLDGLANGDRVVHEGILRVREGSEVRVLGEEAV
ncbi:multidrug-efflux system secretion protein, HlyD family [Thioalkalivibrio nitratireducens DSM 14787]|uniref:Multidrug-efflux system secretion protein, HlyD family n=1 Tax=Thioalkalivibrio nitratireducens (strain DSM 14787 / UNIQEM 213 / ALEN2) TaxID=1255043 RepID=L0DSL5_THIND|nr:multidrug-efflux system secretion protein, HlyD family [Thioalkalivibrio nitratireducens DSM 14787]